MDTTDSALNVFRDPLVLFFASLAILWFATWLGATRLRKLRAQVAEHKEDFGVVQGATLTLLALIIGFTFSMALGRYDQRKDYEEEEANAIGTEYVLVDFLPEADAANAKHLLRTYLDQRISFYTTRDREPLEQIAARTADIQTQLWTAIRAPAAAQPTQLAALVVTGMTTVLNSQGYTQAAWWYRIPVAAWTLMVAIAICAMMMVGIGNRDPRSASRILLVFPLVVSIAFFLIADIDSPRHGLIRVHPHNLESLAQSLH